MSLDRVFTDNGHQLTIFVGEKFDFSLVSDFKVAYSKETQEITSIVIDLQSTEYIDSSALGMLLNMHKTLSSHVNTFKIAYAKPQVQKVLEMARFGKKFEFC